MLCLLFRTFPLVHFVRINNVHLTVNVNDALCSKCLTDESLSSFMTVVFFFVATESKYSHWQAKDRANFTITINFSSGKFCRQTFRAYILPDNLL